MVEARRRFDLVSDAATDRNALGRLKLNLIVSFSCYGIQARRPR
jgi:hypothetical protein